MSVVAPEPGRTERIATVGVSIAIPEPWGAEVQRARRAYGDPLAEVVATHVTLRGPTPVPILDLPSIERHLEDVAAGFRSFRIALAGTGSFRPVSQVAFLRVTRGAVECDELSRGVCAGPLGGDQTFPYRPHVTLAHDVPPDQLDAAERDFANYSAEFAVDGFVLSVLVAGEPWRVLRGFDLAERLGPAADAGARPG